MFTMPIFPRYKGRKKNNNHFDYAVRDVSDNDSRQ